MEFRYVAVLLDKLSFAFQLGFLDFTFAHIFVLFVLLYPIICIEVVKAVAYVIILFFGSTHCSISRATFDNLALQNFFSFLS